MTKILVLLLAASSCAAGAEDRIWRELFTETRLLMDEGNYREAWSVARKALDEAEGFGPADIRTGMTLTEIARLDHALGRSSDAEQHNLRAIRILEQQPVAAVALCTALNALATLYVEVGGRYAEAERLSRRALAIGTGLRDPGAFELVSLWSNLATIRSIRGDKAEALLLFERALGLLVDAPPSQLASKAFVLGNLSTLHYKLGDPARSVSYLLQAIPICEETKGRDHPKLISLLYNLGSAYLALGNAKLAEPPLRRAAAITEARLGAEHSLLVPILSTLGDVRRSAGDRKEAGQLQRRAKLIAALQKDQSIGKGRVDVADLMDTSRQAGRRRK